MTKVISNLERLRSFWQFSNVQGREFSAHFYNRNGRLEFDANLRLGSESEVDSPPASDYTNSPLLVHSHPEQPGVERLPPSGQDVFNLFVSYFKSGIKGSVVVDKYGCYVLYMTERAREWVLDHMTYEAKEIEEWKSQTLDNISGYLTKVHRSEIQVDTYLHHLKKTTHLDCFFIPFDGPTQFTVANY
jgi:hypothetical protein